MGGAGAAAGDGATLGTDFALGAAAGLIRPLPRIDFVMGAGGTGGRVGLIARTAGVDLEP